METRAFLDVEARLGNLVVIRDFLQQEAMARGGEPEVISDLIQAADEAATNIVMHGYRGGGGRIRVELGREGDWLVVQLSDRAPLFDPTRVPPPDLSKPLEEWPLGGLGVHLMRKLAQRVSHRARPGGGNELTLACRCMPSNQENGDEDHQ